MKKLILILTSGLLMLGLTACGSNAPSDVSEKTDASEIESTQVPGPSEGTLEKETEGSSPESSRDKGKEVLVVYFSATGNTKGVAELIADITDADIYEIKALQEYTSDDLNWNDDDSRTTKEQNDASVRPEIGSDPLSLDGYKTIYIGYPIWWGQEPRIMDTFVEGYDFSGITVIPFCTSGSSGIGNSGNALSANAGSGNWLEGRRFGADVSREELESWINGLQD